VSIRRSRRALPILAVALAVLLVPVGSAGAAPARAARPAIFPTTIALPDGFGPEGIAIGAAPFAYFGSTVDGSIFRANLVTGQGRIVSPATGTPSVGMKIDLRGRLFVAGGPAGDGRVVSAATGDVLAHYSFASGSTFVNDVVVTPDAAWFTDSFNPVLYEVPLGRHGRLPGQASVVTLPLTGITFQAGFNVNGISRTPDGRALLVVQTNTGLLFRVDPRTGAATQVDLGGQLVTNGDGILLHGRTLYVVQNQDNLVAVVHLNRRGTRGAVVERVTDPRFDTPTTVARFGGRLYLPNARFSVTTTPTTPYTANAIRAPR